ncbi:LysE family translocator [Dyella silvatica]|uniref:LysE family translocator n=1 Tax=Dyella silvatica TaxID=2992128 RepID=UPI002259DA27|nr:LysE family translocator [Dyella silvatica]
MTHYFIFALAFAASAAAPGPEIAALLSRSLSGRLVSSWPLALGIIMGKLLMLTAAVIGLTALLKVIGPFFLLLKCLGAAYLVWLGIKKWRHAGHLPLANARARQDRSLTDIGLGLAMTLSNPIAIAFYVALLPGVVQVSGLTLSSYLLLCAILIGVMCAVVLGYGLIGRVVSTVFSSPRAKTHVDRASGSLMIGTGVLIALR